MSTDLDLDFSEVRDARVHARELWLSSDAEQEQRTDIKLPSRWFSCRLLRQQRRYLESKIRFNVVAAGRRSFKTEGAKRRLVKKALREYRFEDARFIAAAPTYGQARRIFWNDLKRLTPPDMIAGEPSESGLSIRLVNGCEICVVGMDKPERVEGAPIVHYLSDESANMKPKIWEEVVSPALAETGGTADFIGVPEGRNHFYDMFRMASTDTTGEWMSHHWTAEDALPMYLGVRADRRLLPPELKDLPERELGTILAAREIASAKARMDPLSYDQEFRAAFVTFQGRAYYRFDPEIHASTRLEHVPYLPLILCFDFNVDPGVAVICQEFPAGFKPGWPAFTGAIGEVYIERNSNTPMVCRKILADWAGIHSAPVHIYGDATGGARSTVREDGSSNWDVVRGVLRERWSTNIAMRVPRSNPTVVSRLNSSNSRLCSEDGTVSARIDPVRCPMLVRDLDGTQLVKGGDIEIDKKFDPRLSHLSDAWSYYIAKKWPIRVSYTGSEQF